MLFGKCHGEVHRVLAEDHTKSVVAVQVECRAESLQLAEPRFWVQLAQSISTHIKRNAKHAVGGKVAQICFDYAISKALEVLIAKSGQSTRFDGEAAKVFS